MAKFTFIRFGTFLFFECALAQINLFSTRSFTLNAQKLEMWFEFKESNQDFKWNEIIYNFPQFNMFQTYEWGEYKKRFGWSPFRFYAQNEK